MGLFKRGSGESREAEREREERQAADIERITAGGIPQTAEERLRRLGAESGEAFTSDLSVPEFALIRRHGLDPLTQVMGTSMYHVGWQSATRGFFGATSQELGVLTDAFNDCRRRALDRLQQEAGLAGADAVVGVRITTARYDWGNDLVEFQAIGTAVRAPSLRTPLGAALTNLSRPGCRAAARRRATGRWASSARRASSTASSTPGASRSRPATGAGG